MLASHQSESDGAADDVVYLLHQAQLLPLERQVVNTDS